MYDLRDRVFEMDSPLIYLRVFRPNHISNAVANNVAETVAFSNSGQRAGQNCSVIKHLLVCPAILDAANETAKPPAATCTAMRKSFLKLDVMCVNLIVNSYKYGK